MIDIIYKFTAFLVLILMLLLVQQHGTLPETLCNSAIPGLVCMVLTDNCHTSSELIYVDGDTIKMICVHMCMLVCVGVWM